MDVALAAVLAALYSAYVSYFAVTSFGPLQIRVVDALLPLPVLFGFPAIVGVTIGGFIGNLLGKSLWYRGLCRGPSGSPSRTNPETLLKRFTFK
jgi:uncharacterized membrane protein